MFVKILVSSLLIVSAITLPERRYHRAQLTPGGARIVGTVNPAEHTPEFWAAEAKNGVPLWEARGGGNGVAKNLVLFLGDGMGLPTLMAARTYLGQLQNKTGEESYLSFETFPTVGLAKTYCVDQQIPDSACTATAYHCGVKNNYGTLGVTADVRRMDCLASQDSGTHLRSIAGWALDAGLDVGIVTTTRVTHASPAGIYSHVANRDWESDSDVLADGADARACPDIAYQLVNNFPGNKFKVILGGGRREFTPKEQISEFNGAGHREDSRDLVKDWLQYHAMSNNSAAFAWDRASLAESLNNKPEYLLGLFADSHMEYASLAPDTQPTLAELTEVAIKHLSRNPRGFYLFVEGGRIDHAHHDNQAALALREAVELSKAVDKATELLGDDTLMVVTADHSHVLSVNGYTRRGSDILGLSDQLDDHEVPYMTLTYSNGPAFRPHSEGSRVDITQLDYQNVEFPYEAAVPLDSETHGGEDVAVFAKGPYHAAFTGMFEQSRIPRLMAYVACIGDGPRSPACKDLE